MCVDVGLCVSVAAFGLMPCESIQSWVVKVYYNVFVLLCSCLGHTRSYRLAAYRQYTYWVYQRRLGKHVRHVIPACAVKAIRDRYPEASGDYQGFHEADAEEEPFWPGLIRNM